MALYALRRPPPRDGGGDDGNGPDLDAYSWAVGSVAVAYVVVALGVAVVAIVNGGQDLGIVARTTTRGAMVAAGAATIAVGLVSAGRRRMAVETRLSWSPRRLGLWSAVGGSVVAAAMLAIGVGAGLIR